MVFQNCMCSSSSTTNITLFIKSVHKFPMVASDAVEEEEAAAKTETVASNGATTSDDATLIQEAEALQSEERLIEAAKLLKKVQNKDLWEEKHRHWIRWADATEVGMRDLLVSPMDDGSGWKKQSECHGHRDFLVYYKVNKENHDLACRIDGAIESSLLNPIIAVFNESSLYDTWMPSWKKPIKLGIQQSKCLKEQGRCNQIVQVTVNMAWPLKTREVVYHVVAVDVIEEEGAIAVQAMTEHPEDDPVIPEALPGVVRIDFDTSLLIRACPPDHSCLAKSKHVYPEGESLILISLKNQVDAHVSMVPQSLINFVTRTVIGSMWSALLQVAEDVRDGKRPLHKEAIENKQEIYQWIEQRVDVMLDTFKEEEQKDHLEGG